MAGVGPTIGFSNLANVVGGIDKIARSFGGAAAVQAGKQFGRALFGEKKTKRRRTGTGTRSVVTRYHDTTITLNPNKPSGGTGSHFFQSGLTLGSGVKERAQSNVAMALALNLDIDPITNHGQTVANGNHTPAHFNLRVLIVRVHDVVDQSTLPPASDILQLGTNPRSMPNFDRAGRLFDIKLDRYFTIKPQFMIDMSGTGDKTFIDMQGTRPNLNVVIPLNRREGYFDYKAGNSGGTVGDLNTGAWAIYCVASGVDNDNYVHVHGHARLMFQSIV
jgi:hypothetical protein